MEVRFHPDAESELLHEVKYYDSISDDLGARFCEEIDTAIDGIKTAPFLAHNRGDGIFSVRVHHFPFSIYYRVVSKKLIRILSIFNDSNNPEIWKAR